MAADVPRVLLVGLDVGDGPLIHRWARNGHLPVMASLIERGTWEEPETTAEILHVSAWPSIYTGAHPGEHGVYYTFQPAPGLQGYRKFGRDQYGRPTFWNLLSRAGVRCTVFDAPYTHPEVGSRAVQLFDWGTWAHYGRPMSSPAGLLRRLTRACGPYPLGLEALDTGFDPLDPDDMRQRLCGSARAKAEAARWLMRQSVWDVFFVVFGETHVGAHYCWAAGEGSDEQTRLRTIYEEIDRGIGALLDEAGREIPVVVVSGDGVGPNRAAWHLLPEVLRRLGMLAEPSPETSRAEGRGSRARARDPIRRLRDALPVDFRRTLARRLPESVRHRLARRVDLAAIDWSKTRAYCLPTDLEGCLRINLKGREPEGVVRPGEEYLHLCDEIASALGELADPVTERPAVRAVARMDALFPGPRRDWLPDLVVTWEHAWPLSGLSSPGVGEVVGPSPDPRPGTHAPRAFILRAEALMLPHRGMSPGHVCDLAPELLSLFGVPLPDYMRMEFTDDPLSRQGGES